jgi:hypothetical protein
MLLYKMVLCFAMWGGTCGAAIEGAPVSQQRCYQDLAQLKNLHLNDRAWCQPVWIGRH